MRSSGVLRFLPEGADVPLAPGETVLSHARKAGIPLFAPCGGEGRCGKCRVVVAGRTKGGDDPGVLSPEERGKGTRLACRCLPLSGGLTVTVPPGSRPARLAAYIEGRDMAGDGPFAPLYPASQAARPLGIALDIGTSTLAGALVDLADGAILARTSADNPQMACGEDLISRIVFGEENRDGFGFLRSLLLQGIGSTLSGLLSAAPAGGRVVDVTAAGNTVLSHILFGISPAPIRRPPHRPLLRDYPVRSGREIGVPDIPDSRWRIFPSIGGFVGGDVVAGILASGMHREEAVSLLFDVGTNGEVVLGNSEFRVACSSSAGPAFEGGEVACGMRASPGAIDSVRIDRKTFAVEWTVIGGGRPLGICGSGILDLCAELYRAGLVDRAGRFVARQGAPFADTARGTAFVVAKAGPDGPPADLAFAASDMKSVLRTKAALCAAADSLIAAVGLPREAVARVFVAGGFGNFIDLRAALDLGLFPPYPLSRFVSLGNASLAGAIGALRNRRRWHDAVALATATSYHELSSDPGFMEAYQRALFIPHTDPDGYRAALAEEP